MNNIDKIVSRINNKEEKRLKKNVIGLMKTKNWLLLGFIN